VALAGPRPPAPFLDSSPPPWAARSLATVLLLLFAAGGVAMFVVRVPETVSAPFVLRPVRGADPVRTLHDGIVAKVMAEDAQPVAAGAVLFVVESEPVGDRVAERQTMDARLSGGRGRLANEQQKYNNQRLADVQEKARLEQHLANLDRQIALKQQQHGIAQDIAARQQKSFDEGVGSWVEALRQKAEADRLAVEIEQMRSDGVDSRHALERLAFEMASRHAEFVETERAIGEDMSAYRLRKGVLDRDRARQGNAISVETPCAGTVVNLHVRSAGAVVHEGDTLAEVACEGEQLEAELLLPDRGMALARPGQPVKLLYDAFPYERYGVHFGTLRWISPSSTSDARGAGFRALADLGASTVGVQGLRRPVLAGMTGRASVVVGRRSLASYAVEPLRQLRESLAAAPPAR
jgi:membrane fusion protein